MKLLANRLYGQIGALQNLMSLVLIGILEKDTHGVVVAGGRCRFYIPNYNPMQISLNSAAFRFYSPPLSKMFNSLPRNYTTTSSFINIIPRP